MNWIVDTHSIDNITHLSVLLNFFDRINCNPNSNSNSTFIMLNLCQKTDSKAHHTKNIVQYS